MNDLKANIDEDASITRTFIQVKIYLNNDRLFSVFACLTRSLDFILVSTGFNQ